MKRAAGEAVPVYVEIGRRRVFASAVDWPGWCRGGKTEDEALTVLAAYAPRFARTMGRTADGLRVSDRDIKWDVVERVAGNATTDFGAPGVVPRLDEREETAAEAQRLTWLLQEAWGAFDRAAGAAEGWELARGPRGGGRSLDAIVAHVRNAEGAYLAKAGGPTKAPSDHGELRSLFVGMLSARAAGEPPPRTPKSGTVWPVPYAIRRSAWHALDHAWEIEDRAFEP